MNRLISISPLYTQLRWPIMTDLHVRIAMDLFGKYIPLFSIKDILIANHRVQGSRIPIIPYWSSLNNSVAIIVLQSWQICFFFMLQQAKMNSFKILPHWMVFMLFKHGCFHRCGMGVPDPLFFILNQAIMYNFVSYASLDVNKTTVYHIGSIEIPVKR